MAASALKALPLYMSLLFAQRTNAVHQRARYRFRTAVWGSRKSDAPLGPLLRAQDRAEVEAGSRSRARARALALEGEDGAERGKPEERPREQK